MIKVAIVDNERLLRTLLNPTINSIANCHVILEAVNGQDFIEKLIPSNPPDIVFLDLNMPEKDGFETAKWLAEKYPDIKILVLTGINSDPAMMRLLKMGVRGFIKKEDFSADELKGAIETTMETGYYYNRSKVIHFLKNIDSKTPLINNTLLTEVEMKFLRLACTSKTYRNIAEEMKVSPRTVDGYRESLFEKLSVSTRVEMALFAVKHGIIQL